MYAKVFKASTLKEVRLMKLLKVLLSAIILAATPVVFANPQASLSPPWEILRAKLNATIGADPCVKVSDIEGRNYSVMKIRIDVCNYNKALALAGLLQKKYTFGKISVTTPIYISSSSSEINAYPPNNLRETWIVLNAGLSGNPYIEKIEFNEAKNIVYIEFKPIVVQYYSDDISDLYRNTNMAASAAFRDVFYLNKDPFNRGKINAYATTVEVKKGIVP